MENTELQEYRTFYTDGDTIHDNGTRWADSLEQLQADFAHPDLAIVPIDDVPTDWRDMTIVDGALVLATAEVVENRRAAQFVQKTETVRQARAVDYVANTDPLMIDVLEDYARANPDNPKCVAWLAAKSEIKLKHPKSIKE